MTGNLFYLLLLLVFCTQQVKLDNLLAQAVPKYHIEREHGQCVIAKNPKWILYNRIGKAGSTSVSKYLARYAVKNANPRYHEFVYSQENGGVNDLECWSSAQQCSAQEGNIAERIWKSARLASHLPRGCADPVIKGQNDCSEQKENVPHSGWGPGSVITSLHSFLVNWAEHQQADKDFATPALIQVLRNGSDRYVSQYFFHKAMGLAVPDKIEHCIFDGEKYAGCPPLNYQTKYLCGYSAECDNEVNDRVFLRAAHNLVTQYAVVGVIDHMGPFVEQLAAVFPSIFDREEAHIFAAESVGVKHNAESEREAISASAWRAVQEGNRYDDALYLLARKLSSLRHVRCLQSWDDQDQ
eukprot:m.105187 g.105187  ORF g.105187 m.105187 type:complete len:354 (-) comp13867_c0_seq7:1758-2819(-)